LPPREEKQGTESSSLRREERVVKDGGQGFHKRAALVEGKIEYGGLGLGFGQVVL